MNDLVAASVLVLLGALALAALAPDAAADRSEATVTNAPGSSSPGCEATDECFIPHTVTIDVGGEVTWVNEDTTLHTMTSGVFETRGDGVFDSGFVNPGFKFSYKFEEAGEYTYYCAVHPWMTGLVVVQDSPVPDAGQVTPEDDDDALIHDAHVDYEGGRMDAYATTAVMILSDGTQVTLKATEPVAGESMGIHITFEDSEHTNYDIMAMQDYAVVLNVTGAYGLTGTGTHMTSKLASDEPVSVTVTFRGYGVDDITGPQNETLVFVPVADLSRFQDDMHDASPQASSIITASGSAAIMLDADRLHMELGVSTIRDTAVDALNDNSGVMNRVIDAITSLGINQDDLSTAYLYLRPEYESRYDAETGGHTLELMGYEVTHVLNIDTDQIDKAADILDGAVSAGANHVGHVQFAISPERESEARDGLISAAVDNAKHKAMLAIDALDYHIVGVKSVAMVDPGVASDDEFVLALARGVPPVLAGSQHLVVSVTVTFYIDQ